MYIDDKYIVLWDVYNIVVLVVAYRVSAVNLGDEGSGSDVGEAAATDHDAGVPPVS